MKPVAMPTSATTHIQKIAPGPPSVMAMATPTMLPVPTRLARPMVKAWKEEIPPSALPRDPKTVRIISGKSLNCTARLRMVK